MANILTKEDKKALKKIAAKMAKHRDALRELQSELEQLSGPNDEAIEYLNYSIEKLSEVV